VAIPLFNALGTEGIAAPALKLTLDWGDEIERSHGNPDGEFSEVLEHRTTLLEAGSPPARFSFFVGVPFAQLGHKVPKNLPAIGYGGGRGV
jgi:hypothetical protein